MTFATKMLDSVERSLLTAEITCAECGEPVQPDTRHDLPCGISVCEHCWCRSYTECQMCDGHAVWCTFSK